MLFLCEIGRRLPGCGESLFSPEVHWQLSGGCLNTRTAVSSLSPSLTPLSPLSLSPSLTSSLSSRLSLWQRWRPRQDVDRSPRVAPGTEIPTWCSFGWFFSNFITKLWGFAFISSGKKYTTTGCGGCDKYERCLVGIYLENIHQSHRHLSAPVPFTSVWRACSISYISEGKELTIHILVQSCTWSFPSPRYRGWEVNVQLVDDVLVHVEVVVLLVHKVQVVVILVVVVVVQVVGNVGNSAADGYIRIKLI